MNLYGQAALAKHLNDTKNIERNYWRVFKELEASKKRVEELEREIETLSEENKKLKATKKSKTVKNAKPVADTPNENVSDEEV